MEIVSDRFSACQRPPRQAKITTKSVRECLQPENLSEFQARMTQIRSILVLKNSDKEWSVGKSRPKFANLPSHLVDSDFGYRARDPNNVDNTIHGEYEHDANYEAAKQPGYQLTRRYTSPFDRRQIFGRSLRLDPRASRIQRLFRDQSASEPECEANEKTNYDRPRLLADAGNEDIFDRIVAQSSSNNIYEVFHGAPVQRDLTDVKNALAHVNGLRLVIKKRDSDLIFLELMDHYSCVDKDKRKVVDSAEFYRALATLNIKPNPKMFNLLLKIFEWIKGSDICYEKALDLLNWKYVFPSFEKLRLVHPVEERNYTTTYQDTMA